ncbi:flavoprotein [Saccharomonospora saliphila]|uniref:flavoprotein n=1 Tax=Saccharomonospora saliphila TaxID=369829 RepID=UPI00048E39F8|nr:flavoprotein [Saccharomonospora saliphila]
MSTRTLGLIGSAAGGLERIRSSLVEPALARGWRVAVTLTPTAGTWLEASGERARIEQVTGLPCRVAPRLPSESSPHPPIDCYLVCPASANTVAKMALGLADNQALTTVCEAIGSRAVPVVVFPRINAAHARQPAWDSHIAALRGVGVHLLMGEEYWPLHEPRSAPGKDLPWEKVLDAVDRISPVHGSSSTD